MNQIGFKFPDGFDYQIQMAPEEQIESLILLNFEADRCSFETKSGETAFLYSPCLWGGVNAKQGQGIAITESSKLPTGSCDPIYLQVRIGEECDARFSSHNPSFPRPSFHWRARIAALVVTGGCQEILVRITKRATRVGRLVENISIMEILRYHP